MGAALSSVLNEIVFLQVRNDLLGDCDLRARVQLSNFAKSFYLVVHAVILVNFMRATLLGGIVISTSKIEHSSPLCRSFATSSVVKLNGSVRVASPV